MNNKYPVKTFYYTDELRDEFSSAEISPKHIGEDWCYVNKSFRWRAKRFVAYRLIAYPIAHAYCKLALGHRVKNRSVLKKLKGEGCFLFGNHTQQIGDAFIPSVVMRPKGVFVVVHPNNVSMPVLGKWTPYLGAMPLPSEISAMRNFKEAIGSRIKEGACVAIYPEAHIWPYYTGIRNFPYHSMMYPAELGAPSYAMTTVYKKRRLHKKPRAETYVDGPFYPDMSLPLRARTKALRDEIFAAMTSRSELSDCEYISYKKKETTEEEK